jgi:hypothetical protein
MHSLVAAQAELEAAGILYEEERGLLDGQAAGSQKQGDNVDSVEQKDHQEDLSTISFDTFQVSKPAGLKSAQSGRHDKV